jgi:hypothetical protein
MHYRKRYHGHELPIRGRMGHYTYEVGEESWDKLLSVLTDEQKEILGLKEQPVGSHSYPGPF